MRVATAADWLAVFTTSADWLTHQAAIAEWLTGWAGCSSDGAKLLLMANVHSIPVQSLWTGPKVRMLLDLLKILFFIENSFF